MLGLSSIFLLNFFYMYFATRPRPALTAVNWSACELFYPPEDGDLVAVLELGEHRPQLLLLLLTNVHRQVHDRLVDALRNNRNITFVWNKIF